MAGRSVGSIEVTVDANTGKLVAQLRRAGTTAGKAFKKAAEKELRDLEATVEFQTTEALRQARVLRRRIEQQLRDIPLGLDTTQATRDLRQWQIREGATELELDADIDEGDLARIETQIEALTDRQHTIELDAALDISSVQADLARLEAQRHTAQVDAELDEADYRRQMARLATERHETQVRAVLDTDRVEADLERLRQVRDIDIEVGGDFSGFDRALVEARTAADQQLEIPVDADIRPAITTIEALRARAETLSLNLDVDIDLTRAAATIAAFRARQQANDIEIPVNLDVNALETAITRAVSGLAAGGGGGGGASKAGQAVGNQFVQALTSTLGRGGTAIAGAVAVLAQPAAVALEGAFGGAVAVVSSGMSALLGTAGALGPVLAGIGTSVATLKIGLDGVADALNGDADALARLTPAARDFVAAFDGLRPAFEAIRRSVQERLFEGLGDALESVARVALPAIIDGLDAAADSLNQFFRDLADVARQIDFSAIFESIQPAVDSLLDAVVEIARTVEPFLLAAAPAAQQLAEYFQHGAEQLRQMVEAGLGSGAITDFLTDGIDSLKEWVGLAGAVADALITLFDAGRDTGDSFVRSLAGIINRFDDWMESVAGQTALADFFSDVKEIIGDLAPIAEGLIGFFDRIITPDAIDRFGDITEIIGDLLPVLGTLFDIVGRASEPLIAFLGVAADILALFAAGWEKIPDPMKDVIVLFVSMQTGFLVLDKVIRPLIGLLGDLSGAFETGAGVVETFIGAIPGAGPAIQGLMATISAGSDDVAALDGAMRGARGTLKDTAPSARQLADGWKILTAAAVLAAAAAERNDAGWRAAESSLIGVIDPLDEATKGFERLKKGAEEADTASQNLQDTLALFLDPAAKAAQSASDYQANLDDLVIAMQGGAEAERLRGEAATKQTELNELLAQSSADLSDEEKARIPILQDEINASNAYALALADQAQGLDITGEAGREASAAGQALVDSIVAQADAMIAQGKSQGEAAVAMAGWREEAIQTAIAAGATREEAEALINTYGLTPDAIATTFIQSNLTDAQKMALQYDADLNGIPDAIDTLVNIPGLSEAQKAALLYDEDLDGIPDVVDTEIKVTDSATEPVTEVTGSLEDYDGNTYAADIEARNLAEAKIIDAEGLAAAYAEKVYSGTLAVDDEATPLIDEAAVAAGNFEGGSYQAVIGATDEVTPVLQGVVGDVSTFVEGSFVGVLGADSVPFNTTMEGVVGDATAFEGTSYAAKLDANREPFNIAMDGVVADAVAFETTGTTVNVDANRVPFDITMSGVVADAVAFENGTYETRLTARNDAAIAIDGAIADATAYDALIAEATLGTEGTAAEDIAGAFLQASGFDAMVASATLGTDGTAAEQIAAAILQASGFDAFVASATLTTDGDAAPEIAAAFLQASGFDAMVAKATLGTEGTAAEEIAAAFLQATGFDAMVANATVGVDGAVEAEGQVGNVSGKVTELDEMSASPEISIATNFLVMIQLGAILEGIKQINSAKATPDIKLPTYPTVLAQIIGLIAAMARLDATTADPRITIPTWFTAISQVGSLSQAIRNIPDRSVTVTANVVGLATVRALDDEIDALRDRTVTITTRRVTEIVGGGMTGAIVPGAQTGALVRGPRLMNVGERGYDEAIIPLQLPLNRIDPSVRELAAMLRGGGTPVVVKSGPNNTFNQTFELRETVDPVAVATQIVNRSAMLAH